MKKLSTLFASLALINFSYSQTVSYEILEDNPETVRSKFVALEFLNADIGGKRNTNTISLGVNGIYSLTDKFGLEGKFGYAVFKDEDLGACITAEIGGFVGLSTSTKKKDVKVRTSGKNVTVDGNHAYQESFILVPATNLNTNGLRGGLYINKKGYKLSGIHPYSLVGIYAGWSMTQKTNLVVKVLGTSDKSEHYEKPLYYTGFTRYYVDALITPVSGASNYSGNKLFGGRAGVTFYKDGPKWFNKFMWGLETGVRPVDGFYFKVAAGLSVYRGK